MVFPGHIAGGYLATKAILALAHVALTPGQTTALIAIGTIAGDAPDMDILFYFLHHRYSPSTEKKRESHRTYITHAPLFWLVISAAIAGAGWIADSAFTELLGAVILGGTWSHFFFDSFEYGIRWLWPFSDKRFTMREVDEPQISAPQGSIAHYLELMGKVWNKRITFLIEPIVVIAALWVAFHG